MGALTMNSSNPLPPDTEARIASSPSSPRRRSPTRKRAVSCRGSRRSRRRCGGWQRSSRRSRPSPTCWRGLPENWPTWSGTWNGPWPGMTGTVWRPRSPYRTTTPAPAGTRVPIDAGTGFGRAIMEGRTARIDILRLDGGLRADRSGAWDPRGGELPDLRPRAERGARCRWVAATPIPFQRRPRPCWGGSATWWPRQSPIPRREPGRAVGR